MNVYGIFVECGGVSGKGISRFGAASEQPPTQALVKRFLRKFQLEIHLLTLLRARHKTSVNNDITVTITLAEDEKS